MSQRLDVRFFIVLLATCGHKPTTVLASGEQTKCMFFVDRDANVDMVLDFGEDLRQTSGTFASYTVHAYGLSDDPLHTDSVLDCLYVHGRKEDPFVCVTYPRFTARGAYQLSNNYTHLRTSLLNPTVNQKANYTFQKVGSRTTGATCSFSLPPGMFGDWKTHEEEEQAESADDDAGTATIAEETTRGYETVKDNDGNEFQISGTGLIIVIIVLVAAAIVIIVLGYCLCKMHSSTVEKRIQGRTDGYTQNVRENEPFKQGNVKEMVALCHDRDQQAQREQRAGQTHTL